MALGKIKADTLEHSTAGSVDTQYVVSGSAKATLMFDHVALNIDGSLNISSVADTAIGQATPSFTSSVSLGYATTAVGADTSSGQSDVTVRGGGGSTTDQLTTSYRVLTYKSTTAYDDALQASVTVGDLV